MDLRIRRPLLALAALAAVAFAANVVATPRVVIGAIHVYQRRVAPLAEAVGARCRFTPTCSRYAEAAIARDGTVRGGWRALKRIARCGPWTAAGTVDRP